MNPNTTDSDACPDDEKLRKFLNGDTTHQEIDALGQHLDVCVRCQERAEALQSSLSTLPSEDPEEPTSSRTSRQAIIMQLAGMLHPVDDPSLLGKLGDFLVRDVIDSGGMGIVLAAADPDLKRDVAIKVLSPHLAAHPEARERFLREAQAAASIDHENVMPIFSVVRSASLPYLVMPLNEGGSLQDYLLENKHPPFDDVVRIGKALAQGLAAAHAQALIHRDVKPANVLLEHGLEKIRLSDFGVARAAEAPELTRTGVIAGTPAYMAPEQIDGEDVDQRADLFGLGVVLYTLVTGANPFEAATTTATIKKVAMDQPQSLSRARRDLPASFRTLVEQLLEKLPENRPQSASEVGRRLETLNESDRSPSGLRLTIILATVAVIAVAIWFTVGSNRPSQEERRDASRADLQLASDLYATANYEEGMALLCRALRSDPENSEASQLLVNELLYRPLKTPPLEPYVIDAHSRLLAIRYSSKGERLMAYGLDKKMHFWKTATFKREIFPMSWPAGLIPISYAKEAAIWAFYFPGNRSYWFVNPINFGFFADPASISEPHACAALSDDASLLLAGGAEGGVYLWDIANDSLRHTWRLHGGVVTEVALSSDNRMGVSVSEDGTGILLDLQTGKTVGAPMIHDGPIRSLVIHQEQRLIATGSTDNTARLWKLEDAEPVTPPLRHAVNCPEPGILVAFTNTGERLLTGGSNDHALRVWDTRNGQPAATGTLDHPDVVSAFEIDASGTRLATGCADGTARVWHLDSFRKIAPTFTLPHPIEFVTFSTENQLAITTIEGVIHVHDLSPTDLVLNEPFLQLSESIAGKRFQEGEQVATIASPYTKTILDEIQDDTKDTRLMRVAHWLVTNQTERERSPLNSHRQDSASSE